MEASGDAWSGVQSDNSKGRHTTREQAICPIRIVTDPTIMLGKPVIEGTRITVELILEDMAQGATVDELMGEYDLTRDAVLAAIHHAWELTRAEAFAAVQRRISS